MMKIISNILRILNALVSWLERRGQGVEQKKAQAKADEIHTDPKRTFIDKFWMREHNDDR